MMRQARNVCRKTHVCTICGRNGHFASACMKRRRSKDKEAFCFYCKTKGHWEESCYYKENNIPQDKIVKIIELGEVKDEDIKETERSSKKRKEAPLEDTTSTNGSAPIFVVHKKEKKRKQDKENGEKQCKERIDKSEKESESTRENEIINESDQSESTSSLSLLSAYED